MHELASEIWIARTGKQWDKVESYARQWLAQEPTSIFAAQLIGEALEKQGRIGEALLYYEKALERDREEKHEIGHTFFLKRLDILYYRIGRYEDCLRINEYYTKRHPENWDAWNRLKRAAKKTGNSELSSYAKKRADEIRNKQGIAKKKAVKATDEPRPNIRGKPLPEEEALAGWEVNEDDIERAQRWIDKAMKEAGLR